MTRPRLVDELADLQVLTRDELCIRWSKAFGSDAPAGVRRDLLMRGVAWDLQSRRLGGLSTVARRLLKAAKVEAQRRQTSRLRTRSQNDPSNPASSMEAAASAGPSGGSTHVLHPGSRIVRDWCGQPHVVDVVENGFVYDGKVHQSLTSIARLITRTNWSGPRFFGLVNRRTSP